MPKLFLGIHHDRARPRHRFLAYARAFEDRFGDDELLHWTNGHGASREESVTLFDAMLRLAVGWMHQTLVFSLAIRKISMHKGHCHRPFADS